MKMKRLVLATLALALTAFALVFPASAAEAASGTCGENLTWTLDDAGVLTITGTGDMKSGQFSNSSPFYSQRANIRSVVIEEGVTGIGDYAFQDCTALVSVKLPTTLLTIGQRAFEDCSALLSIEIPANVTDIGYYAFDNCDGLTSLVIPDSVQTLGNGMIYGCGGLTALSLGSGVQQASGSNFYMCDSLETITVAPENEFLTVQNGVLFSKDMTQLIYCPPMNPVGDYTVPDSVTNIGIYGFYHNKMLTGVAMGDHVTALGSYAFCGCGSLATVELSDALTELPEYAFEYTSALKSIELSEDLTTLGKYAFCGSGLETVYIPDGVTKIPDGAFRSCAALAQIRFPSALNYIGWYAFQYCDGLTELSFPDSVTNIGMSAFAYCDDLEIVTLPGSVTTIGSTAFFSSPKLRSVTFLGDAPTSFSTNAFSYIQSDAVLKYPFCFDGWSGAERTTYCDDHTWEGYLPNTAESGSFGDGLLWLLSNEGTLVLTGTGTTGNFTASASVTTAPWRGYARQIKKVWIDEGITGLGNYLFYGCSALETVEFAGDPPSISTAAFAGVTCTVRYAAENPRWTPEHEGQFGGALTWKPLGQTEDYIAEGGSSDISWVLDYEGVLTITTQLDMPDYGSTSSPWYNYKNHIKTVDLRSAKGVGTYAFYQFAYLEKIIMPTSLTYGVGNYAFYGCDSLKELFFPADTSYMLGQYAFAYCTALERVSFSGRTKLSYGTFYGCARLAEIYINDALCIMDNDTFAKSDTFSGVTATVNYPVGGGPYYTSVPTYGGSLTWEECSYGVCGPDAWWEVDEASKTLTITGTGSLAWYGAGLSSPWYNLNDNITTIIVGEGITDIPRYAFEFCDVTETVILPDSLKTLSISAFRKCQMLNNLILPNGLEEITNGYYAFNTCPALTDLYYFGTEEEWDQKQDFNMISNAVDGFTIHFLVRYEIAPTCTESGTEPYYRYDTTDVYPEYYDEARHVIAAPVTVSALDHDWLDATCTAPKSCTRCPATEGEALNHDWLDATCTAPKTCTRCPATEGEALDHNFTDGECTRCPAKSVKITKQPVSVRVAKGSTAKVTVSVTGDGLTYRWYFKNAGASRFRYTATYKTANYAVKMDDSRNGRQIYCVITDQYGNSVTTDTVTLSQRTALSITEQPASVTAAYQEKATVKVTAVGDGLTYTWYVKNAGSAKWVKSSITTNTYTVKMASASRDRLLYCVITDQYGNTAETNKVYLRMAATITTQPKTSYTKQGKMASVTVKASGDGLTYTWYVKNAGSAKWVKSSITTNTYSVKMASASRDRLVYCVITDQYGNTVETNKVYLRMAATITTQPKTSCTKLGAFAKATVKASGDGLRYQWYVKNAGSSTWVKSSITTNTYTVKMASASKDRSVYCIVTDKYGKTAVSDIAVLHIG